MKFLLALLFLAVSGFALADEDRAAALTSPFSSESNIYLADITLPLSLSTGGSPITGSLVCSRTTGVASLFVFCDASGTIDPSVTAYPYHDLQYTWNFGDPNVTAAGTCGTAVVAGEGFWRCGSRPGANSKNAAMGPLAGHVFDPTPGGGTKNYTISLTIYDGTNTKILTQAISVTDPNTVFSGTNTVCFFNSAVGTGCPAGATQTATSAFDTALNSCIGTTKRCLFKRGDAFLAAAASVINSTGPGLIGAYGSGAAPVITGNSVFVPQLPMAEANLGAGHNQNVFIELSAGATPTITDWRIMDLELDGQSVVNTMAIASRGGIDQVTILRVNCHHMATTCVSLNEGLLQSINGTGNTTPFHIWDQFAIVDSNLDNLTGLGHINAYTSATNLMLAGNTLDTGTNEIVRWPYVIRGVLSNNYIANTNKNHLVKIHAPNMGVLLAIQIEQKTQYLVISDNKVLGDNGAPTNPIAWPVAIGPFDNLTDERVYDIIYERNWHVGASTTQVAAIFWADDVSIRDNIVDLSGSLNHTAFKLDKRGAEPAHTNTRLYNNTFYTSDTTGNSAELAVLGATETNVTARNNLAYTPHVTANVTYMVRDDGGCCGAQPNNSTDHFGTNQMRSTDPKFTCPDGCANVGAFTPANAKPLVTSYAIGTGANVPVWSDFFLLTEPSPYDIGAVKH